MKKALCTLLLALFSTVLVFGQDGGGKDVNINVNTKGNAWYTSPWVWVVGAAVFILLLVALMRGGGRRSD
jgi:ABC-type phosphate transport system auxiliary subunit